MDSDDRDVAPTGTDASAARDARRVERQARRDGDDDLGGASGSPLADRRVLGAVGLIALVVLVILVL